MAPLKVLVIGGGVAGPAFAYWLGRTGANITLLERSSGMRASGQQVDLRGQGVEMMKRMGIEAAVRDVLVHEIGTQMINEKGQVQAWFPAIASGTGRQSVTSEFEIMRGDLVRILYDLTADKSNVKHVYGLTADDFTQDADQVTVRFSDGTSDTFDLVVGADGSGSHTRRIMLGPGAPDPRHRDGGWIGFYSMPSAPEDPRAFTFCHLPGSRIVATRRDCDDLTRVYMMAGVDHPTLNAAVASKNLADLKHAWADLYRGGPWQCERFVDALEHAPEADDLYCTPWEEVRLAEGSWSSGRVVLLGDAAHSQTANGVGTTWGLVGAYILAGEIASRHAADPDTVPQAGPAYEKIFRPIATATHGGNSALMRRAMAPNSRWGIWLLHSIVWLISKLPLQNLPNIDSKTSKWQLPYYSELHQD